MKKHFVVKKAFLSMICLVLLGGCYPFSAREDAAREAMKEAEDKARRKNRAYKMEIRQVKPYQVYSYQSELKDPFRMREFLLQKGIVESDLPKPKLQENRCIPPSCVPPAPHPKQLLENYGLKSLAFVGTFDGKDEVGLIKTPDVGIVLVKVGDYMGLNYGKVLAVKSNAIILQEKINQNGLWKNKKTVLKITQ